ncbi:MAG: response regulator transcription factor [Myxococcota bacterium]
MSRARTDASTPAASAPAVLVVEDEEPIRRGLCDVLVYHGYAPEEAERGDTGLDRALAADFALIVLDVMLPGLSGFDVCSRLREVRPDTPVLMLTARGSEEDVLQGFRCGADDYVTKPFSIAELMARVEALLRRSRSVSGPAEPSPEPFELGPWRIDPERLSATSGEREVLLTRRELEIAGLLVRESGRIVSRRRLLRELWGYPDPERVETRTVDMHIAKLRKKLGSEAPALIETVRGEGYRLRG